MESDLTQECLVHDLNNVFETIVEAAELLSTDPHWEPLAATIQRSVARGRRLVSEMPETGADLDQVLDNAIQFIEDFLAAASHGQLTFLRHGEAGIRLLGSPSDWERVFVNLFLNAAQASGFHGTIEVSARRETGGVEIDVADDGPGIPPGILGQIFEPHFSTKTATRSGLGLHIVETIVTKNGGRVSASNRESGSGARFAIRLPA